MAQEFWTEKWAQNKTAFHEGKPNELLAAHVDVLAGRTRVLVPLAGKSVDMLFLRDRGHEVVGVEYVQQAIDEFGAVPGVTMVCADYFTLRSEQVGTFDAIYDRAAMVAIDPADRGRYVATCRALLREGAPMLLVAFSYDQTRANGPPWSIDRAAVDALFAGWSITELATHAVPAPGSLGAIDVQETLYLLR